MNVDRQAAIAAMVPRVAAAAEVMGGRRPSPEALGVLAKRLVDVDHDVAIEALRWLGENENGVLTLARLVKAINDVRANVKLTKGAGGGCVANGCPLHGTINVGSGWRCRFHLYSPNSGPIADAITNVLRQNDEAVRLSQSLAREPGQDAWKAFQGVELFLSTACGKAQEDAEKQVSAADGKSVKQQLAGRAALIKQANDFTARRRMWPCSK